MFPMIGCAASKYQVLYTGSLGTELQVTPDRVLLECEDLYDSDNNIEEPHGFIMHVLDNNNTVITLIQGNVIDKQGCYRKLKKIGAILRKGQRIYIASTSDLNPINKPGRVHHFPKHGTYYNNGVVLNFVAIANEHGQCYDTYFGEEPPCPRDQFPIKRR